MRLGAVRSAILPSSRKSWATVLLLSNLISWGYLVTALINQIYSGFGATYERTLGTMALYYLANFISALLSSSVAAEVRRSRKVLGCTVFAGGVLLLPTIFYEALTIELMALISFLSGVSLGSVLPSCLAFFSENTRIDERGRTAAVILFITYVLYFCLAVTIQLLSTRHALALCALWRFLGLVPILYLPNRILNETRVQPSCKSILSDKTFIVYIVPWIVFLLVDATAQPLIMYSDLGEGLYYVMAQTEMLVGGVFTLLGGLLLDFIGRKKMIIWAFAVMGVGYALLSFSYRMPYVWVFYSVLDGSAWSTLTLVFTIVLWGDLSKAKGSEKYYALGLSPIFMAGVFRVLLEPLTRNLSLENAFSFASFFLFLAVLPLAYAEESLPESVMRLREIEKYIRKVREAGRKYG